MRKLIYWLSAAWLCSSPAGAADPCAPKAPTCKRPPTTRTIAKEVKVAVPVPTTQSVTAPSQATATTGGQTTTVIVQAPAKPQVVRLTRTKYRTRVREVERRVLAYRPNRLLFLLGTSRSDVDAELQDCCRVTTERKYAPDFGLQYVRDFGTISGSAAVTIDRSIYLGLGVNW